MQLTRFTILALLISITILGIQAYTMDSDQTPQKSDPTVGTPHPDKQGRLLKPVFGIVEQLLGGGMGGSSGGDGGGSGGDGGGSGGDGGGGLLGGLLTAEK